MTGQPNRVARAMAIIEETPEAAICRQELYTVLLQANPRLLYSLIRPIMSIDDLAELFNQREQGRFLRALLVAMEFLGWRDGGPVSDLDLNDLRCIDACLKHGVTRLLISNHFYQLMRAEFPEFIDEFDCLLKESMFLSERLNNLTIIIVGLLWRRMVQIRSGVIVVILR